MYTEIKKCRLCGNPDLIPILDLGHQALTGVFPRSPEESVPKVPLTLVKCSEGTNGSHCGLIQLLHSCNLRDIFTSSYGYRSSLNKSMVTHLKGIASSLMDLITFEIGDILLDIGSNDGTFLNFFKKENCSLLGIDPIGVHFKPCYPDHIDLVSDFFSASAVREKIGDKKVKVITSLAILYDLEDPMNFIKDLCDILDDDGLWVFEQSYFPAVLKNCAYDVICHEHFEYYSIKQIMWMLEKAGLKIVDIRMNETNGGSFLVTAAKTRSSFRENSSSIEHLFEKEKDKGMEGATAYKTFSEKVSSHREKLRKVINDLLSSGKKILGYGASTKGNVLLQYCGLSTKEIPFIAEVNEDKFGKFTPGSNIPIISEREARAMDPDVFLVLPWHFRENIITKEKDFLNNGKQLLFPLPEIKLVGSNNK